MKTTNTKFDTGTGESTICPLGAFLKQQANPGLNCNKQQTSQPTERNMKPKKNCTCCKCADVSSSVMFTAKTTTSYNTATGDNCSCTSCTCSEISSTKIAEAVNECTCLKCVCPVCPRKPTQRPIQTTAQVGDTATTTTPCNCKKCVCAVCPFKTTDSNMAKASQTNKQTIDQGTGERGKCDCSISTDPLKAKAKLSEQQTNCICSLSTGVKGEKECKCTICPDRAQNQRGFINESVKCKCTECKCNPCADPEKKLESAKISESSGDCQCPDRSKIAGEIFKSPTTCYCSPCKCSPCSDPTKMNARENIADKKDTSNVNDCGCKLCSDPSKLKPDAFKKPVACNCERCVCNPCADLQKKKQVEGQKKSDNDVNECSNDDCDCNPCVDPNKAEKKSSNIGFQGSRRVSCNCTTCTCNPCDDKKSNKEQRDPDELNKCHCPKCYCNPCRDPNVQQANQGKPPTEICDCDVCNCGDSKKSSSSPRPCDCPVCKCDPCNDPNVNKAKGDTNKELAKCHCPACSCKFCPDPNIKQSIEKEPKAGKIGREDCICDPCLCSNNKKQPTLNNLPCDCPACSCQPCNDPNVKGGDKPVKPAGDDSNCTCSACICSGSTRKDQNENAGQRKDSGCKCPECMCANCFFASPADVVKCKCERCTCPDCYRKKVDESSQDRNCPIFELSKCLCSPCKCHLDEPERQQGKDIKDNRGTGVKPTKDDICICTTCDCPEDKKKDTVNVKEKQPSAAVCDCDPCTCVDCTTKIVKDIKQSGKDKNICLCSPCNCVDCLFGTKNYEKADAPGLEFKCTCVELPMGRTGVKAVAKSDINKFINPPQSECPAKTDCMSYGCHRIVTNIDFKKFEIPTRLQSASKNKRNSFELENLFKSVPERLTIQKRKKKQRSSEREQVRQTLPPHSERLLPQAKYKGPTEHVVSMSEHIKNFKNKSYEKHFYELSPGDYSKLDKYKENIQVIKNSLKKIQNNREKARRNNQENKPFNKTNPDFIETMSELEIAFNYLKKNFKPDDEIIKAVAKEIKRYTSSNTLINLFNKQNKHEFTSEKIISVPAIPVLQPTKVSVRPSSAAPGQHRPGLVCRCSVCTGPNPDLMCHSGDTSVKPKQSKLVRTINYEKASFIRNSNQGESNFSRLSDAKDSECYFIHQFDSSSDHTKNVDPIGNVCRSQIGDFDIYDGRSKISSETINPLLVRQASSFEHNTLSDLKVAVNTLQAECKAKDKIIEKTTEKLRQNLSSSVLMSFMDRIDEGDVGVVKRKTARNAETQMDRSVKETKKVVCKCGKIHKDNKHVSLSGFRVVNIKRITVDSVIIEWRAPKSKFVTGYEIEINGQLKSKVMSSWRTCAMVHSVDMSPSLNISIYAITPWGRCHPPARAIYEIRRKEKYR